MQNGLRNKIRIAGILLLLLLLIVVRLFQEKLFYDPFLIFFRGNSYKGIPLPSYDSFQLILSLFFRYTINTVLSLAILWLFFKDSGVIKLSSIIYAVFFVVLAIAFFVVLQSDNVNLLVLFYIRRFLIQPLFLILFVPAFYYQRK